MAAMRTIGIIVFLLIAVGWLGILAETPVSTPGNQPSSIGWRRTVNGWEKVWMRSSEVSVVSADSKSMHPTIFGRAIRIQLFSRY